MRRVLPVVSILGVAASALYYSSSALALEPSAIYAEAKEFTVQIDGEETGTGTIVENNNGTYTVLTCWHVMDTPGNYQVTTADGATYEVTNIENLPDVDLALITFSAGNVYPVAELGDSAVATSGFNAYVVGYPDPFPGVPEREYFTDSAEIQSRLTSAEQGYQIVHSGSFTPGSSGGGIFDSEARLIAVNGQFISEGNTGKAYGAGIPLEIYLATQNNFAVPTKVTAPQDPVSVGKRKLKQEDYQGAIVEFDKALAANPDDINSLHSRAIASFNLRNFNAAISDLDRVINLNLQNANAYKSRGLNYSFSGDYRSALADYNKAILLNPQDVNAYIGRGSAYGALKYYDNAIADFSKVIGVEPKNAYVYYNRANTYKKSINNDSASGFFSERPFAKANAIADFEKAAELFQQQGNTQLYQQALAEIKELQ